MLSITSPKTRKWVGQLMFEKGLDVNPGQGGLLRVYLKLLCLFAFYLNRFLVGFGFFGYFRALSAGSKICSSSAGNVVDHCESIFLAMDRLGQIFRHVLSHNHELKH